MTIDSEVKEKDWTFENLTHKDRVERLREILNEFDDILKRYKEHDEYPHGMIIDTFTFKKPLTSIDISNVNPEIVKLFIENLREFFFITYTSLEINISRFRTLCDVAVGKLGKGKNLVRLSDKFADLAGIFYGYSPRKILEYCLEKGFYHIIKY